MKTTPAHLFVALPAEARPLIQGLELVRETREHGFPLYRNGPLSLVVTGAGPERMRRATQDYQTVLTPGSDPSTPWVNIGIAGHARAAVGTALLAHTLVDAVNGRRWTLANPLNSPCASDLLTSVARPDDTYRTPGMVDMEAATFFSTVRSQFDTAPVHCLKVISDNPQHPMAGINSRFVHDLIADKLDLVERLLRVCRV